MRDGLREGEYLSWKRLRRDLDRTQVETKKCRRCHVGQLELNRLERFNRLNRARRSSIEMARARPMFATSNSMLVCTSEGGILKGITLKRGRVDLNSRSSIEDRGVIQVLVRQLAVDATVLDGSRSRYRL